MRSLKLSDATDVARFCSTAIQAALAGIVGVPLSEAQWQLASFPLSSGGLGITNPIDVAPAAAVSSFLNLISSLNVTGFRCARIPPNFLSAALSLAELSKEGRHRDKV